MTKKDCTKYHVQPISLDFSAKGADIVREIARVFKVKVHENTKGISAYIDSCIRISDHCTYMQTWVDNNTYNAPCKIDIVIEDSPTQAITQVEEGYNFTITEFVYKSSEMTPEKARMIAYDIREALKTSTYANNVRGEKRILNSSNNTPTTESTKKTFIKLTENDLRQIVIETVKSILRI